MRLGTAITLALPVAIVVGVAVIAARSPTAKPHDDPWAHVPKSRPHLDHSGFFDTPFEDGPSVTRACLECHTDQAHAFMKTSHWTWHGPPTTDAEGKQIRIGKKNLVNNFCGGIESNWTRCTSCHAGYGWKDHGFDFSDPTRVDCLVCHDTTTTYRKAQTLAGHPAENVDLLAVAKAVGTPSRQNCGQCHFQGGGGDAVKHGDLDGTMYHPTEAIDVHMGRHDFQCTDCHRATAHEIPGRSMSVSVSDTNRVACNDCHAERPHGDERLDDHVRAVACQTCHIPLMAVRAATKMSWDWSTAGQDLTPQDPRTYSKKKGTFTFAQNVPPEYRWYDGGASRYLPGEKIDPTQVTELNAPHGEVRGARARIWPFKIHRGKQVYDVEHAYLHTPKTFGEGGYWSDFDWDKALRLGADATGLPYSGTYAFAPTVMYWPLSHMVAPKERALQCADCHGKTGRMDWQVLGYRQDPALGGGRRRAGSTTR